RAVSCPGVTITSVATARNAAKFACTVQSSTPESRRAYWRGSPSASGDRDMTAAAYDVVILGSGQAAGPLATALVKAGRRVALAGPDRVLVRSEGEPRELRAATIVINTGARTARPRIPGLETIQTLDSTSIMELDTVPQHLIVVGGGYIGVEFGPMFRRFGSRVTILQKASRLLAREDADVAEGVAAILREDGIDIRFAVDITGVAGTDGE